MGEKELAASSTELMPGAREVGPAGATASAPSDAPRMAAPASGDGGGAPEPEETAIVKSKSNITNN